MRGIAGRFFIEEINENHLDHLFNIRNSIRTRQWFFDDRAVDIESHRKWYSNYELDKDDHMFVIGDAKNDTLIGTIGYKFVDDVSVEFGRFIIDDEAYLHKYYTVGILRRFFQGLFDSGVNTIFCKVNSYNTVAIGLYSKLGFVVYGFTKKYSPYEGRILSVVSMVLTKERFINDNYRV